MNVKVFRKPLSYSGAMCTTEYYISIDRGYFKYRVTFTNPDSLPSIFEDKQPEYLVYVIRPYALTLPDGVVEITSVEDIRTVLLDLVQLSNDHEFDIKILKEMGCDCDVERAIHAQADSCILALTKLHLSKL